MAKKIHYYWMDSEMGVPSYMMDKYKKEGYRGAIDGYLRPRTTSLINTVTCKLCIKEMYRKGMIGTKTYNYLKLKS